MYRSLPMLAVVVLLLAACSPKTRTSATTQLPLDLFVKQDTFLWRLRLDARGNGWLYRTGLNSPGSVTWVSGQIDRKGLTLRPARPWTAASDSFRFQGRNAIREWKADEGRYEFNAQVYTDTFFRRPLPRQYLLVNSVGSQASNHGGGYTDEQGQLVLSVGSHDISFGARVIDSTVMVVAVPEHLRKLMGKDSIRRVIPVYDPSTIRRIRPAVLVVMPDRALFPLDTTFKRWDVTLYRHSQLQALSFREGVLRSTSPGTWDLTLQTTVGTQEVKSWQPLRPVQ